MNDENACFVAGTLVQTKEGLKPIEDIRIGDWVLSYPDDQVPPLRIREAHEYTYRQVTRTFVHEDKVVCEVTVLNFANNIKAILKVTPDHPFSVKNQGWLPAGKLNCTKALYNCRFANLMVGEVIDKGGRCRVYNLEVEDFQTYYVGELQVWVHNKVCKAAVSDRGHR